MRFYGDLAPLLTTVVLTIRFLVSIVIAVAIYRNAASRAQREYGIPAVVWAALALAEPVFGLGVYWFMHRPERGVATT